MRVSLRLEVDVTEEQNRREATNTVTVTYFIYCSAALMFEWSSMLGLLLAGT